MNTTKVYQSLMHLRKLCFYLLLLISSVLPQVYAGGGGGGGGIFGGGGGFGSSTSTSTSGPVHVPGRIESSFKSCMDGNVVGAPRGVAQPGGWVACMMLYCDRNYDRDLVECRWYQDLVKPPPDNPRQFIGHHFQELKNFLAIQQLEFVRDEVLNQLTPAPFPMQTAFAGYKFGKIQPFLGDEKAQRQWQLFVWDMFSPEKFDDAGFVYLHTDNYCSYLEAEYSPVQQYCGSAKMAMPYDLLATTLLSRSTLPPLTSETIYQIEKNDIKRMYVVDQEDRNRFETRYGADNPAAIRSYGNINRQEAALAFIRNLTNGVPLPMLASNKLFDDPAAYVFNETTGIPYLTAKYEMTTQLSMARNSLLKMYTERVANTTIKRADPSAVSEVSEKASLLGLLEEESTRRFMSFSWHQEMSKLPEEALLRELSSILALQMKVNYRIMEQYSRLEALFSASFSNAVGQGIKIPAQAEESAGPTN